jgi:ATP-dependent Zn protease
VQKAYDTAKDILVNNHDRLEHIAQRLINKETIETDELEKLFTEPVDTPNLKPASRR